MKVDSSRLQLIYAERLQLYKQNILRLNSWNWGMINSIWSIRVCLEKNEACCILYSVIGQKLKIRFQCSLLQKTYLMHFVRKLEDLAFQPRKTYFWAMNFAWIDRFFMNRLNNRAMLQWTRSHWQLFVYIAWVKLDSWQPKLVIGIRYLTWQTAFWQ